MPEKAKAKKNDPEIVDLYQDPAGAVEAVLEGLLTPESQQNLDANAIESYNENDPVIKHKKYDKAANRIRFTTAIFACYCLVNLTLNSDPPQITSIENINRQFTIMMTLVTVGISIGILNVAWFDYILKTSSEQDEEKAAEKQLTELYTQVLENGNTELASNELSQKQNEFATAIRKNNWHRFEESLYTLLGHRALPFLSVLTSLFMIYMIGETSPNLRSNIDTARVDVLISFLIIPLLTFFGSNILLGKLKQSYSRKITGLFEGELSQVEHTSHEVSSLDADFSSAYDEEENPAQTDSTEAADFQANQAKQTVKRK